MEKYQSILEKRRRLDACPADVTKNLMFRSACINVVMFIEGSDLSLYRLREISS